MAEHNDALVSFCTQLARMCLRAERLGLHNTLYRLREAVEVAVREAADAIEQGQQDENQHPTP